MVAYGSLKPGGYIQRLADPLVEKALQNFGGVEICGARWSGKSWTAGAFGESIARVDENPDIYLDDPVLALAGESPHIVDEWQDAPAIWNAARHRIDDRANKPGQFILTGSSTPPEAERRHSGAGRIARVRMHTMTLLETGESSGKVSLADLFEQRFEPTGDALGLLDIAQLICRGGWPALQDGTRTNASLVVDDYLEALFEVSMPKAGKSPTLSRRIARSLARNVATSATLGTISADSAAGEDTAPDSDTVASYLDVFHRNYFIEEVSGWDAPVRSKSRVRTKPKRYFCDPSLASSLLGVDPQRIVNDGQLFGLLFESLCMHEIAAYAALLPGAGKTPLHYYSDADGLEVDAVIELSDGRWAGIEIKLGESKVKDGVANLKRLREKVAANPAARNPKPEFMAVLLGKCAVARYLRDDDVYVVPVGALAP